MTPKTQSVCKHCQHELVFISKPAFYLSTRTGSQYCSLYGRHGTSHEPEYLFVAEPASTGEHKIQNAFGRSSAHVEPVEPSGASTGEPPPKQMPSIAFKVAQKVIDAVYGSPEGQVLSIVSAYLETYATDWRAARPSEPSAPIRLMAGNAPKVEEIMRKIIEGENIPKHSPIYEKRWSELLAILRPYFPPASQTPQADVFSDRRTELEYRLKMMGREFAGGACQVVMENVVIPLVLRIVADAGLVAKLTKNIANSATPASTARTRFKDFDDAEHPANIWWQKYGQFMMAGGSRKQFIWACRGWIAREQMAEGVEVTGDSLHETLPAAPGSVPPHDEDWSDGHLEASRNETVAQAEPPKEGE